MVTRRLRRPTPAEAYDDEEDEQPARRRRFTSSARDNGGGRARVGARASTKSRDEDDDERPSKAAGAGWRAYKRTKENAPSKWEKVFKVPDEGESLIKFIEDAPYVSFLQHWADWRGKGKQQSFVCLQDDCPVCEVDTPSARIRFNILNLDGDEPVNMVFEVGITLADTLQKYSDDPKIGPLTKGYFAVGKTGGKKKTTNIRPIKERDLKEDFDFDPPLDREEVEQFRKKMWDVDSLRIATRRELAEVADEAAR